MACELNTEKYTAVVEKLIKKDPATYTNFDNVAKFILKSEVLTDEQKKMSLHNVAHIFKSLSKIDPKFVSLGKTSDVINNVGIIDDTVKYMNAVSEIYTVKATLPPSLESLNKAIERLGNNPAILVSDITNDLFPAIAKYIAATTFTSEEAKETALEEIRNAAVTVLNKYGDNVPYREMLIEALNNSMKGLKPNSEYVALDDIAPVTKLDNVLLTLTSGAVIEGFSLPDGTIKIVSSDGSLVEVAQEEIVSQKVSRNTSDFFSNSQGKHKFFANLFNSAFSIVAVNSEEQSEIMEALNNTTAVNTGIRIKKVELSTIGDERVTRVHGLAKEEPGMRSLLNRQHETFETPTQIAKLKSEKDAVVLTVARPTQTDQNYAFVGEIVETGQKFYLYSFDNYAFVRSDNTTELVDFTNPEHLKLVKELSVKQTAEGEISLSDTDIETMKNAYEYFAYFKETAGANPSDDVTNDFLSLYDIQQKRGGRYMSSLTNEIKEDLTLSKEVKVVTQNSDGTTSEESYRLPVYFYKKYDPATGEITYTHKTVLAQNQKIKHTRPDGTDVLVTEALYVRDAFGVTEDVVRNFFEAEDEHIKKSHSKNVRPTYQTNHFVVQVKPDGTFGYRSAEPKRVFENSEYFPHFIEALMTALSAPSRITGIKSFDKSIFSFPLRKGLAVNLAANPNRAGKLFLELRAPYNSQSEYSSVITSENKSKFNFEIDEILLKNIAEAFANNDVKTELENLFPALTKAESIYQFYDMAFELLNANSEYTELSDKLEKFIAEKMDAFSNMLKTNVIDKLEQASEGTGFMEVFKKQYSFGKDNAFQPEELLFEKNSNGRLVPRIQFSFQNRVGETKFNKAYKNLWIVNSATAKQFSIKPKAVTEPAPQEQVILETTYPVEKTEEEVIETPPTTNSEELGYDVEDDPMAFSMEESFIPATTEDVLSEAAWLKEALPQIGLDLDTLAEVINLSKIDGNVLGAYKDKVIYLNSQMKAKGTLYHEAFHGVFRNIFTEDKRTELIDSVANLKKNASRFTKTAMRAFAKQRNLAYNETELRKLIAEEILAEGFQNYMLNKTKPKGLLQKFFEVLKNVINFFLNRSSEIDAVYGNIRKGHYKNEVLHSGIYEGTVAFELIPGLKSFSQNEYGKIIRRSTNLSTSEQRMLVNFVVGEIATDSSDRTFEEKFDEKVDRVLNDIFNIDNLVRQNPSKESEILKKYGPLYSNFRFVLGARLKTLPLYDVNNTEIEAFDAVVEKNMVTTAEGVVDNTNGEYSYNLFKKAVKLKVDMLDAVSIERDSDTIEEVERMLAESLTEEGNKLENPDQEISDENKDSADFDQSFNEYNRMDSYVSYLRRFISAIRSDKKDDALGISVPQMVDGESLFGTLLKITADVEASSIVKSLKTAAETMIEDGRVDEGSQILAVYNEIEKHSKIENGIPTRNTQIFNIITEVLHGVELDYAMFTVRTPGKDTADDFENTEPAFKFTLRDKVIDSDTNKKRDNIISSILMGFKNNSRTEEYKKAVVELTKLASLIGKSKTGMLSGINGQSIEVERLSSEISDLFKTLDIKLPKSLIKLSLLAIEEKVHNETLELTPSLQDFYEVNSKFVKESEYLEQSFFIDLANVLGRMFNAEGKPSSVFPNYLDDSTKDLGRFMSILKKASVFVLKYDPTELPSVIRNAEGKPIYRYTKYTPLATLTQKLRRQGLQATLEEDPYYIDSLLDFMKDNGLFGVLLDKSKEGTKEFKEAALLVENMKIALFGGVQQIQGKHYTDGKSFKGVDERSLYILNILSFLKRQSITGRDGKTSIQTYMRSYHQVEATQTNFLMTGLYKQMISLDQSGSSKYEKEGKATYKGKLAIVEDLEKVVKQEYSRIKKEWNERNQKKALYDKGDENHGLILKYNGVLNKDGVTANVDDPKLRAYNFNILDTFFNDPRNKSIKDALIQNAKDGLDFEDESLTEINKELLNLLDIHANEEFNKHLSRLETLGLVTNVTVEQPAGFAPVEYYTSKLLSDEMQNNSDSLINLKAIYPKAYGQTDKMSTEVIDALLFDHYFNFWRNALYANQLFDGDVAMNVKNAQDYVKRNKKLAASGSNMKEGTHKVSYLNAIVGYVNRTYPEYGPYYSLEELENDTLVPEDIKKELVKEYGGEDHMFEIFDGQSISTLTHQMDMHDTLGRLDETARKILIAKQFRSLTEKEIKHLKSLKIVNNAKKTITANRYQYHKLSEGYIDRNDVSYLNVPEEEVEQTYEVLDRLYSNVYENKKSIKEALRQNNEHLVKSLEQAIKKDVMEIHSYFTALPHRKHMHNLLNSMEYYNIDQIMDTTASKNATKLPVDFFKNKTGENGYLNLQMSSVRVSNEGKYLQVETSGVKDKSKVSVQKKLLIAADLEKISKLAELDAAKGGKPVTDSERKAMSQLTDVLVRYQSSLKNSSEARLSYLKEIMREGGHFDVAKVFKIIQDNLIAQNSPETMIKMFDVVNGKPVLSPNLSVLRNTLEYYFFSQYSNHVTDEKASGFKNFHESSFGYEVIVDENNNVIPTEEVKRNPEKYSTYKTRNLGVQVEEVNGVKTYFVEAIFPMPVFENNKHKQFYMQNLTKMFGVRIPTEDKRSMIAIKAVDFVDSSKLNNVIVPHLVHILSGSDFDIDSLFGQMFSYYKNAADNYSVYGDYTSYADPAKGKYVEFLNYMKKKSDFKSVITHRKKELSEISKEDGEIYFFEEVDNILAYSGVSKEQIDKPNEYMYEKMIELQAMLEVFSKHKIPVSFEQFSENPSFGAMVSDIYQNQNLQASLDILSNEAVFKRLYINQQSSVEAFKDILKTFGISLDEVTKKGSLFTLDNAIASKVENAMNKDGIGMTASLNKFLAMASEHTLELAEPIWNYMDFGSENKVNMFDKYGSLNIENERAIALIGNILGMFADGAKEPIAAALQMNEVNASTTLSMIGLGMKPSFAFALNFIPEVKIASARVQEANFAITEETDVKRLFFATEISNEIDKLHKENPSAMTNLINAGILFVDMKTKNIAIDNKNLKIKFEPQKIDLGRLRDGMLTVDEIGFDVENVQENAVLSPEEKKIVLLTLYRQQADQSSVNQKVASLANFFKSLNPSFKATDKILETLEKLLDPEDGLIFTPSSVSRMFSENSVFRTMAKTFYDLNDESKRLFLERSDAFAPLVKAFGNLFQDQRTVAEVMTGFLGISKFISEVPGSRKSSNPELQNMIEEDDKNLLKTFTADFWFINDLDRQLSDMQEKYPDNAFLKLLRPKFGDEVARVAVGTSHIARQKIKYISLIGKTKITGELAKNVADDVRYLFEKDSESKMFIKNLFYHEIARSAMQFKSGSFLKYLPDELMKPVSDNVQLFVDELNSGKPIQEVLEAYTKENNETYVERLLSQISYAVANEPGKSKVKKTPFFDLSKESSLAYFIPNYESLSEREIKDKLEKAILSVIKGSPKVGLSKSGKLYKVLGNLTGESFTLDLSKRESAEEDTLASMIGGKMNLEFDSKSKTWTFPSMLSVDNQLYALKKVDNETLSSRMLEKFNTMAVGNTALYEKVKNIPNNDVISPLVFNETELARYDLIASGKLVIGSENIVKGLDTATAKKANEDSEFDIPDDIEEDSFEQSGSLASLGIALEAQEEESEEEFADGSGSLLSLFGENLSKEILGETDSLISTPETPIEVYSDGSDIKGTGRVGFGAVFVHNGKEYSLSGTEASSVVADMQVRFPDATFSNPTMEMLALVQSLESFKGKGEHIVINQDYKGAVNFGPLWSKSEGSAQRDPKPWKPKEAYVSYLVDKAAAAIEEIEANGGSVKIKWVKGHSGNVMNEKADQAAKSREEFNTFEDVYKDETNDNDKTPCQGGSPF